MLQAMAAQLVWRDEHGTEHGGGSVTQAVPGRAGSNVNLRMVLDDAVDPPQAGEFSSHGSDGSLIVKVRKNPTAAELTEVLYHEAMHLVSWLINDHGATISAVDRRAARALDLSHARTQIAGMRRELGDLAADVNPRRSAAGRTAISSAQLDRMASWLMEEVLVRAETQVFQLASQVQAQRGRGAAVYMPTQQYGDINRTMVDHYVFEFSHVFDPADRTGQTTHEQDALRLLMEMMEGFYQLHVRRRFSLTAYTTGVPRAPVDIPLTPLTPPSFLPGIGDATHGPPF
jgi:hypothetical protein